MTGGTVPTTLVDANDIITWFYLWSRLLEPRSKAAGSVGDIVAIPVGKIIDINRVYKC